MSPIMVREHVLTELQQAQGDRAHPATRFNSIMNRRYRESLAALFVAMLSTVVGACGATRSPEYRPATTSTAPTAVTIVPATTLPRDALTTAPLAATSTSVAPPPSSGAPIPTAAVVITRANDSRRAVALTFDAGSDVGSTARILDLLAADHIRATFGITGRWAEDNPALLRRIAASGHQIINHTYGHPSFTGASTGTAPLTRAQRLDELSRAETAIEDITGAGTHGWFRPPYGDRNSTVDIDVGAAGYRYELMWTVDSLGWKGLPASSVAARCLAAAAPGAIILMHVGATSTDAEALPELITRLAADGYTFLTAAQLVAGEIS